MELMSLRRRALENAHVLREASGSIANFTTYYPASLKSCVCEIEPVQDLHGYNYPWPAGGGKNLYGNGDVTANANAIVALVKPILSVQ